MLTGNTCMVIVVLTVLLESCIFNTTLLMIPWFVQLFYDFCHNILSLLVKWTLAL